MEYDEPDLGMQNLHIPRGPMHSAISLPVSGSSVFISFLKIPFLGCLLVYLAQAIALLEVRVQGMLCSTKVDVG